MPLRYGKCINFGLCTVADSKKPVELPETELFVCPECEKPLQQVEHKGSGSSGGSSKKGIWVAALALLMVVGGVLYLVLGPPDNDKTSHESHEKDTPGADNPKVVPVKEEGVILRLHGSNTIGSDLAPALAREFLLKNGSKSVTIDAGSKPNQRFVNGRGKSEPQSIEIYAPGSGFGFTDLGSGATDIAMSSRRVKGDEKRLLERLGDMESPGSEHVVGLDGVAVIVNQNNPITQLSIAQLRDIFSGRTLDWSGVGGHGGGIHLYALDDKSGTYETVKSLVLDPLPLASARRFADHKLLSESVAGDPQGIGFVGLPFVGNNRAVLVNSAGARPLAPTFFTVAREDYPLSRRLFLYTAAAPTNAMVNSFIEFALSPAGQDIVKRVGFASQNIVAEPPSAQDEEFYRDAIRGAMKLNLVFRFQKGRSELDNKARRDLERLIDYERAQSPPQQILLFGYADSTGSPAQNLELSRGRARAVAGQLGSRGLPAARVDGFGQANPVADNSTEEGQEINRRVDAWTRR